jgi:hypothetical protein
MIVQDEDMKSLLQQSYSCFETDSVEGLIQEIGMHRNIIIKFTSGFDPILNRWVPLCIFFLFGKKEDDYKVHWDYIFSVMNYDSWFDFKDCFPGNVCDMSDALGKYFFYSIKKYIQEKFQVMPRDDFYTRFLVSARFILKDQKEELEKIETLLKETMNKNLMIWLMVCFRYSEDI